MAVPHQNDIAEKGYSAADRTPELQYLIVNQGFQKRGNWGVGGGQRIVPEFNSNERISKGLLYRQN